MEHATYVLFAVGIAAIEWAQYFSKTPPSPWVYTVIAAAVGWYSGRKAYYHLRRARNQQLGAMGEVSVGQKLENLRSLGFQVLHDIPTGKGNIDHVVVGPRGIFAVETKTLSKTSRAKVIYDGKTVTVDGRAPDRDPILQVQAEANWLKDFVARRANRKAAIQPVLLFPGWFVEGDSFGKAVWVMNDAAFLKVVAQQRESLSEDDAVYIADVLSEYVRGCT